MSSIIISKVAVLRGKFKNQQKSGKLDRLKPRKVRFLNAKNERVIYNYPPHFFASKYFQNSKCHSIKNGLNYQSYIHFHLYKAVRYSPFR